VLGSEEAANAGCLKGGADGEQADVGGTKAAATAQSQGEATHSIGVALNKFINAAGASDVAVVPPCLPPPPVSVACDGAPWDLRARGVPPPPNEAQVGRWLTWNLRTSAFGVAAHHVTVSGGVD
jgi:hypothetical protein